MTDDFDTENFQPEWLIIALGGADRIKFAEKQIRLRRIVFFFFSLTRKSGSV
jgi:hypothetical protein